MDFTTLLYILLGFVSGMATVRVFQLWKSARNTPNTTGSIAYEDLPDQATVNHFPVRVRIENPEGVENDIDHLSFGRFAKVEFGGTIKKVADHQDKVLVEYTAPGFVKADWCPTGTIFFLTKKEYMEVWDECEGRKIAEDKQKALVTQLLKQAPAT